MALRTPLSVTPHLYMGDSTGRPLDMGTVYFGEQDKDPEFYPINLFSDDALTKPLAQPVHTKGGYLYDKGDMVEPHAKEIIYSVKVLDSYGRKVFYKGAMMRNSWNDDVIEQINTAIVSSADIARQVATDITNEAINNTAVEGGVLADTFVTVTPNGTGMVARTQRDVNSDTVHVKDFGAKCDGLADDTISLKNAINYVKGKNIKLLASGDILVKDEILVDRRLYADFKKAVIHFDNSEVDADNNALKCFMRFAGAGPLYLMNDTDIANITVRHKNKTIKNRHTFIFDNTYALDFKLENILSYDNTGCIIYLKGDGANYIPGFHTPVFKNIKGFNIGAIIGKNAESKPWSVNGYFDNFVLENGTNNVSPYDIIADLTGFRMTTLNNWLMEGRNHSEAITGIKLTSYKTIINNLYCEVQGKGLVNLLESDEEVTINNIMFGEEGAIRLKGGSSKINGCNLNGSKPIEDRIILENNATCQVQNSKVYDPDAYGGDKSLVPSDKIGRLSIHDSSSNSGAVYSHNPNINLCSLELFSGRTVTRSTMLKLSEYVELDPWTEDLSIYPYLDNGKRVMRIDPVTASTTSLQIRAKIPERYIGSQVIIAFRVKVVGSSRYPIQIVSNSVSGAATFKLPTGATLSNFARINGTAQDGTNYIDVYGVVGESSQQSVAWNIKPQGVASSTPISLLISDIKVCIAKQLPDLRDGFTSPLVLWSNSIPEKGYYIKGDIIYNNSDGANVGWRRVTNGNGNALETDWKVF